ncbi:Methionyl-tRNA formyltransferase [Candidatus Johnevansia muelleri]|uniref:methionyl-tRNA formyltransferase n=1 Tax=Candidatus Johnevansia muelleri TaxID=1495769 RepID=A0A078KE20_9GAMM|nr:Methionyl-tRNA formyltransferase [Candidatus Evansia muelleri]
MIFSLRLALAGTTNFAAKTFNALLSTDHVIVFVYTQPDRPSVRGIRILKNPVKKFAYDNKIIVYQPYKLIPTESSYNMINANIDILVVTAYCGIIPKELINIPKLGAINVHASLLPRGRGAAPIQRTIEAIDNISCITITGIDTGNILLSRVISISEYTNGGELHDFLSIISGEALIDVLNIIGKCSALLLSTPQKFKNSDAVLDFNNDAKYIAAFNHLPVALSILDNKLVRIWYIKKYPGHYYNLHNIL